MKNLLERKEKMVAVLEEKMMDLGMAVEEAMRELGVKEEESNDIFYKISQPVDYNAEFLERMEEVEFYREILKRNGYRVLERVIKEMQKEVVNYFKENNLKLYFNEQSKRDEKELRLEMLKELKRVSYIFKEWKNEEEFLFRAYGRSLEKKFLAYEEEGAGNEVYGRVIDELFLEEVLDELSILNEELLKKYNNNIPGEMIDKLYNSIIALEEPYYIYSLRL